MIILHSWGGCGKHLLKASSSPAQDRRRSCPLGTPLGRQCPPGRARSSLLAPGQGRSCFASGAGGESQELQAAWGCCLCCCAPADQEKPLHGGERGRAAPALLLSQAAQWSPGNLLPWLDYCQLPNTVPRFLFFFCLCQAASNLFAIITSCSRSSVNSAAQAPGEMLVCCPWSRAPSDRCAFLPPSTPACS